MSYSTLRMQDLAWATNFSSRRSENINVSQQSLASPAASCTSMDSEVKTAGTDDARSHFDDQDRKEQVDKFIEEFRPTGFSNVPVTRMRHMISLMLMEVHSDLYGTYARKVKGIWKQKPNTWPDTVPYVDPNNKLTSNGSKPKKELLTPMMTYLVQKYMEKNPGCNYVPEAIDAKQEIADIAPVAVVPDDAWISDEDAVDWHPIEDQLTRIKSRITYARKSQLVDRGVLRLLQSAYFALRKAADDRRFIDSWTMEFGSKLELTLDRWRVFGNEILAPELLSELQNCTHQLEQLDARMVMVPSGQVAAAGSSLMAELNIKHKHGAGVTDPTWLNIDTKPDQMLPTESSITADDLVKFKGSEWQKTMAVNGVGSCVLTSASDHGDDLVNKLCIKKRGDTSHVEFMVPQLELRAEGVSEDSLMDTEEDKKMKKMKELNDQNGIFDLLGDVDFLDEESHHVIDADSLIRGINQSHLLDLNEDMQQLVSAVMTGDMPDSHTSGVLVSGVEDLLSPEIGGVKFNGGLLFGVPHEQNNLPDPSPGMSTSTLSDDAVYMNVAPQSSASLSNQFCAQVAQPMSPMSYAIQGLTLSQFSGSDMETTRNQLMQKLQMEQFTGIQQNYYLNQPQMQSNANWSPPGRPLTGKRAASLIPKTVEDMDDDDDDCSGSGSSFIAGPTGMKQMRKNKAVN